MRLPIIHLDEVYHVGTLDASDRGRNHPIGTSLEGNGLSVSVCPSSWTAIARLGGHPCHEMSRPGGRFLDVQELLDDEALREEVVGWGIEEGLVTRGRTWTAWFLDGETDEWRSFALPTREEAILEATEAQDAEEEDLEAPDGHDAVEARETVLGTQALADLVDMSVRTDGDHESALVLAFATVRLPELGLAVDGVWWNERYDPSALSAPRGAILATTVADWSTREVHARDVDDDELVASMPRTEWVETGPEPSAPSP